MKKKPLTISCLLLLAAAVSSCSSDDALVADQAAGDAGARRYTMTVEARKGSALTRALSEGTDGSISATWSKDDTVSVYSGKKKIGKLTAQADGASATLSGELDEAPADQAELTLKYLSPDYANQDGTLTGSDKSIDRVCDYATATVTAIVKDNEVTTTGNADFQNQQAIMKLTLKDQGGSSISATQLLVILDDDTVTVTPAEPASQLYVAVPATTSATLKMEATVDGATYTYEKTDVTIEAGSSYAGDVKMTLLPTDLSMVDCAGNARSGMTTANCYMIHKAGQYKLPLVYGNAIKDGKDNITAYKPGGTASETYCVNFKNHAGDDIDAPWITKATSGEGVNKGMGITVSSADLLWQDAQGLITAVGISGDYLMLTVGEDATELQGNAVVAAKAADGTIVWSWHIWVTKETFATLTTVNTGSHSYKVTPVNLGWVPTGGAGKQGYNTYYQWGRKDAFIPSTGSVPSTGSGNTNHTVYDIFNAPVTGLTYSPSTDASTDATIADNIKNPTTLYNSSTKGSCTTTYYNMWDAQQTGTDNIKTATVKTVYDPSPAGFCVPTGNLCYYFWYGSDVSFDWDGENKGRTLTSVTPNVFFPASGYRNYSDGSLGSVGSSGYYWSASVGSSINGRCLYFYSGSRSCNNEYRALGFSVRAVAEE